MSSKARLTQWDGRQRSSRHDVPLLRRLTHRRVVHRLAVVLATTSLATLLGLLWGPPFPYRSGEVLLHDVRSRLDFEVVNEVELVNQTGAAALPHASNRPIVEQYPRGFLLAPRGQPLQERQLELLQAEHQAHLAQLGPEEYWSRGVALFLIFLLLACVVTLYVARFQTALANSLPTIAGVCVLVLCTLTLVLLLHHSPWHGAILPLTIAAMVFTLVYNPQFALLMSFSLTLAAAVVLGARMERLLEMMGGLAGAVLLLNNVRTRTQLVQVAAWAGAGFFIMTCATGVLTEQTWSLILADALRNFLWGTLAGFLLTGLLPLVERGFGVVTDISLLELADGSHPLLQELVRRAPGTYTHSITVATLAEAAAEAVDANPLLIRVGSYFHDAGKMLKPQYFIENQSGANRHDELEPALSTLVIVGHVKDGVALAEKYRLPRPIIDFVAEHHGTTLVEYFYREAMRLQEAAGHASVDLESSFRYPGPKPQTRESGIIMLADSVESASRSLAQPTPASLAKLVHDLVMKRLLDGQFEESGLTLTELHLIEEALTKSLIALFHARIKYPEADLQYGKAG